MKRVEFKLSMPGRGSWNVDWTGKSKNYIVVKKFSDEFIKTHPWLGEENSWSYNWGDGWRARVSMKILGVGERPAKSDGFCDYDWMVNAIIEANKILDTDDIKEWRKQKARAKTFVK